MRKFPAAIRYWRPEKAGGLAVADIPSEHVAALGGLTQQRASSPIRIADVNVAEAAGQAVTAAKNGWGWPVSA